MKAQVNQVQKVAKINNEQAIRFQLIAHCFLKNIVMSDADLDCLTSLGQSGEYDLSDFCEIQADKRLELRLKTWQPDPHNPNKKRPEASPQTIRNILLRAERYGLMIKRGKGRKKIRLNPDLNIQTSGNILLDFKFLSLDSQKS